MSGASAQEDSESATTARSRLKKLNGRFILKSFALLPIRFKPRCFSEQNRPIDKELKPQSADSH